MARRYILSGNLRQAMAEAVYDKSVLMPRTREPGINL